MALEKCSDFDSKRQFLLDYVEKIVYVNEDVAIYGSLPLLLNAPEEEQGKLEFRISGKITEADRFSRRAKYGTGIIDITLPQYNGFKK